MPVEVCHPEPVEVCHPEPVEVCHPEPVEGYLDLKLFRGKQENQKDF